MSESSKLGKWVESYRNGFGKRPSPGESGPIVLRIADVSSGKIDLSSPRRGKISQKEALKYRLVEGDLLFIRVNGAREIVGRCSVVGPDIPNGTIFNDHLIRVRLEDGLDPEFARLCAGLPEARSKIEEAAATSAGQLTINQQVLDAIAVPDIPVFEQRKIVARLKAQLAEVETARQAAQAQVRDAMLLRGRLLQQAFDTLGDVPRKVLGEWATTTSGSTPSRGDKRYWSPAEIPWVKTGEVAFAPITVTEESISRQALAECSLTLLPPQTVLIAMYGQGKTRGQSAILQVEATTNQACFAILPNETWDADFLHHWMMASYEALRSLSDGRGGNQANLNGALLNALEIPAPDVDEQHRIVTRLKAQLTEADAIHQAAAAQLTEIERLPQRLLAQAFAPPATQGDVT
jgi:type I restriction enzyme S subunit